MDKDKRLKIMNKADSALKDLGLEVIEVEWNGHDEILRLYVDYSGQDLNTNAVVGMDDCVLCSKQLEDVALVPGKEAGEYGLEVSSPGVERPLRRLVDFTSNVGKQVFVQLSAPVGGRRKGQGILSAVDVDNDSVQLVLKSKSQLDEAWTFGLSALSKAHLVYEWGT